MFIFKANCYFQGIFFPTQSKMSSRTPMGRPVTGGRQHSTPATLPKAFQEEPDRMLSRGQQKICRRFWHTPKISQKFSGEWKFGLCCYDRDENRSPHWVSFNFGSIFSQHLFSRRLSTEMLITWKFSKRIAGRTNRPGVPHAGRVFETPSLQGSKHGSTSIYVSEHFSIQLIGHAFPWESLWDAKCGLWKTGDCG